MKALKFIFVVSIVLALVLLNACGGGGGDVDKVYVKILPPSLHEHSAWLFQKPAHFPAESKKYLRILFYNSDLFGFVDEKVFPISHKYNFDHTVRSAVLNVVNVNGVGKPSLSVDPPDVLGFDIDYYHEGYISKEGILLGAVEVQAAYYTSNGDAETQITDVNYFLALTHGLSGFTYSLPFELTPEKFFPGNSYDITFDVNPNNSWPNEFTYKIDATGEGKPDWTYTETQIINKGVVNW